MLLKFNDVHPDNEPVEMSEKELIDFRHGTGASEIFARDLRAMSKNLREAQRSRSPDDSFGKLQLRIPAALYLQEAINRPGCWDGDEEQKTLAKFWDLYPDMRCTDAKSNPFRRRK